ncbi:MAG TPA: MFS transporter [Opitutaceae bacterium]|nr:MFS transporter [Opitutaceae bacterium]
MSSSTPTPVEDTAVRGSPASFQRVVVSSMLGTAIEWYDFFLYGTAAALVFNRLFFPTLDPLTGTTAAFGSYAVGFFARPIGGIIFGHFGDKIGRKSMLVTTLVMMGVATFLIGLLPTYNQVGLWAPGLLVALRVVQGLAVGGEWGGAVLMVAEHADERRRGFFVSWVQVGVPVGLLMATGVFTLFSYLPDASFLSWGWRIPFLFGIVLTGLGFFIRLRVMESPVFSQAQKRKPAATLPIIAVLRDHKRNVLLAMGARMAENAFFYLFTIWVLSYAMQHLGVAKSTLLNGVLIGSAVQLVAIPWFGALSDRFGRKPVYLAGTLFLLLYCQPFFWLIQTGETVWIWTAIVVGMIGHASLYGPQAAFFSELFGTQTRYTGASLGYQLAAPFSGGLAPLIASWLLVWSGGSTWPIVAYMAVLAGITLVSILLAAETRNTDLRDRAVPNRS